MLINEVENRVREVYPTAHIEFDGYDRVFFEYESYHDTMYISSQYVEDPYIIAEIILSRMEEFGC